MIATQICVCVCVYDACLCVFLVQKWLGAGLGNVLSMKVLTKKFNSE